MKTSPTQGQGEWDRAPMLSHHDRCVFIHIPRTAGQSIERVFLDRIGLTWDTQAPPLLRAHDRPELGPSWLAYLKVREYIGCQHMTPDQFAGYFKFAFVRSPWDRLVSFYRYFRYQDRLGWSPPGTPSGLARRTTATC